MFSSSPSFPQMKHGSKLLVFLWLLLLTIRFSSEQLERLDEISAVLVNVLGQSERNIACMYVTRALETQRVWILCVFSHVAHAEPPS